MEDHFGIGNTHLERGALVEAIAHYRQAVGLRPDHAEAHNNLGNALLRSGNLDGAMTSYERAVETNPDFADALYNLGAANRLRGSLDVAIAFFRRALAINPDLTEAYNALGAVFQQQGQSDEAVAAYYKAIELRPDFAIAHNNLANSLKDQARLDEAIASYWRAIELNPDYSSAHSNLIYLLYFHPDYDASAIYERHRYWNEQHAATLATHIQPHTNSRDPERRLRIGYVSPEFRNHCQTFFTLPLLSAHNHQRFEIFCYSDVAFADGMTQRLSSFADMWRNITGLPDHYAADIIRQDQIDILVDLTMHMADGRPLLFARKPAPVQVCWLAYPGTTGLSTMDYRLTDSYLDPPGLDDRFYTEQSIRLPDSFWCYYAYSADPEPNALPAFSNGFVTFGSLNNFSKVNAFVLKLWADVLKKVDRSRLAMLAPEGSCRQRTLEFLEQQGVSSERITFFDKQPLQQYMALYHQIDIGLDTVPYNGHTTSLDSYWMGVPVVTLVGRTSVGRGGMSQLTNLGLADLIATTPEQYVAIASALANDLPRLNVLRHTLRHKMRTSPLMDASRFARNIENAYRAMWQRRCA